MLVVAAAIAGYLIMAAQQEHNPAPPPAPSSSPAATSHAGARSTELPAPRAKNKFGIAGPSSKADPHMAHEEAVREAVQAGILELVDAGAPR